MKTWLVIVSVVAVLLAASTGVGFWMLSDTKAELASTEAELTDINETLEEAKARMEIIAGILMPVMTGELDEMTEAAVGSWFLEWRDQIMAMGDPVLEAKFQAFIDSLDEPELLSFFVYLFESTAEALE